MAKTLDRFDLMRLFIRISETGSLSGAARSMNLSQPSASRQLRDLETDLGVQLIRRSTTELTFTEEGSRFLEEARSLVAQWDTTKERLKGRSAIAGQVRVAVPAGLGQTLFADLAGRFLADHPDIRIDWLCEDNPGDLVLRGIDIWLRVGPIASEDLIVRHLWTIERALLSAPPSHAAASHPKDLATQPAVILGPYVGTRIRLSGPDGGQFDLEPRTILSTDTIFVAERLTLSGHGYSILPLWLVDAHLKAGRLVRLCEDWQPPSLALSLAYPQQRFRPQRVTALIDFFRHQIPRSGPGIRPA